MLQEIYENWMPPTPAFRANHEGVPEGMIPYICCSDVQDNKYNIRFIPLKCSEKFVSLKIIYFQPNKSLKSSQYIGKLTT